MLPEKHSDGLILGRNTGDGIRSEPKTENPENRLILKQEGLGSASWRPNRYELKEARLNDIQRVPKIRTCQKFWLTSLFFTSPRGVDRAGGLGWPGEVRTPMARSIAHTSGVRTAQVGSFVWKI